MGKSVPKGQTSWLCLPSTSLLRFTVHGCRVICLAGLISDGSCWGVTVMTVELINDGACLLSKFILMFIVSVP